MATNPTIRFEFPLNGKVRAFNYNLAAMALLAVELGFEDSKGLLGILGNGGLRDNKKMLICLRCGLHADPDVTQDSAGTHTLGSWITTNYVYRDLLRVFVEAVEAANTASRQKKSGRKPN